MTTYSEALQYIEQIPRFAVKSSPEAARTWLDLLGSPDRKMKILHVAGTNGKGSVCNYLACILREAGYHAGLFISPHLVDIRERIEVDGNLITEEEFVSEFEKVRDLVRENSELPHPAYFEFLFLMAMDYFGQKAPDYVILETGLGGRLDATNTVAVRELSVITRIGMDHMQYLGDTVSEIAAEKAGILRAGTPAVILEKPQEAFRTILQRAVSIGAPVYTVDPQSCEVNVMSADSIVFSYGAGYDALRARLQTRAIYQAENAALAARAIRVLNRRIQSDGGRVITDDEIVRGLEAAKWPGRMEEILPGVWLDGAHNTDGFRAFLESVKSGTGNMGKGRRILLFSAVRDKQYREELRMIENSGLFTDIVAVPMRGTRALTRSELEKALQESAMLRRQEIYAADPKLLFHLTDDENQRKAETEISLHEVSGAKEAVEKYILARNAEDEVYAAGSLYLVGELRALLTQSGSLQ